MDWRCAHEHHCSSRSRLLGLGDHCGIWHVCGSHLRKMTLDAYSVLCVLYGEWHAGPSQSGGTPRTGKKDRIAGNSCRCGGVEDMSTGSRKRYRSRYVPNAEESQILEYYAERYHIARRIGVPRNETAYMIE
jgi:hypothetical protein